MSVCVCECMYVLVCMCVRECECVGECVCVWESVSARARVFVSGVYVQSSALIRFLFSLFSFFTSL